MKILSFTFSAIAFLSVFQLFANDWNQYRGSQSDNKTTELLTSANWLEKDNLVWKTETPLGLVPLPQKTARHILWSQRKMKTA